MLAIFPKFGRDPTSLSSSPRRLPKPTTSSPRQLPKPTSSPLPLIIITVTSSGPSSLELCPNLKLPLSPNTQSATSCTPCDLFWPICPHHPSASTQHLSSWPVSPKQVLLFFQKKQVLLKLGSESRVWLPTKPPLLTQRGSQRQGRCGLVGLGPTWWFRRRLEKEAWSVVGPRGLWLSSPPGQHTSSI